MPPQWENHTQTEFPELCLLCVTIRSQTASFSFLQPSRITSFSSSVMSSLLDSYLFHVFIICFIPIWVLNYTHYNFNHVCSAVSAHWIEPGAEAWLMEDSESMVSKRGNEKAVEGWGKQRWCQCSDVISIHNRITATTVVLSAVVCCWMDYILRICSTY